MKRNKLIGLLSLCLLAATFASCEDWNETEAVKQKVERPEDQNPELWAEYTAALRDYKQSEHFIVYARLFNSPQPGTSEKDFMRCLPDSLDIVSLTNADTSRSTMRKICRLCVRKVRKCSIRSIMQAAAGN